MFILSIVFTGIVVAGSTYLMSGALQRVKDDCNQDLLDAKDKEIQLLMQQNSQLSRELSRYAAGRSAADENKKDYPVISADDIEDDSVMDVSW